MENQTSHNIDPFNEVYYISCFYNPILSALPALVGNIYPVLTNNFFTLSWINEFGQYIKMLK